MERIGLIAVLALALGSSGCGCFRKSAPAPVVTCPPVAVCPAPAPVCDPCAPQAVSFGTAGFGGPSFVPAQ